MERKSKPVSTTRRRFIKGVGAAAAGVIAAPFVISSTARAQNKVVYIGTFGGSFTAAEEAAFYKPFTDATGIEAKPVTGLAFSKLKAMVQSGSYDFDVTSFTEATWRQAHSEGLAEPIDWTIVDKNTLAPDAVFFDGIGYYVASTNLAYRTDTFPNRGPEGWPDFWDVGKFVGDRSLYGRDPVTPLLVALVADGVPVDQVFPNPDIDRAFKSLDRIKPHIKVWWTSGAQSQQLIGDGEVDMIMIWNGRASGTIADGAPVELVWPGATLETALWGVAKGSPNAGAAWEFIQFAVQPDRQADFSRHISYGPSNPKAYEFLSDDVADMLPSNPKYKDVVLVVDPIWGGDNRAALAERFTQWLAT